MPLSNASITFQMAGILQSTLDLQSGESKLAFGGSLAWANGTGNGQADKLWADTRTIAASTTEDIDLAGSLVDAFGVAFTPARIKAIAIKADATNVNNITVGGDANAWVGPFGAATHTISVRPGGLYVAACTDATGWPVTAGTGDILQVANAGAGTSVTYSVALIGCSV